MMLCDSPKNFALDKLSICKSRDTIGGRFPQWGVGVGVLSFSILFQFLFLFISRPNIFARPEFCIFFVLSMFMSMRMADQAVRTDANFLERLSQAVRTDANLFRTASERSGNGKPFGNGKPLVYVFA